MSEDKEKYLEAFFFHMYQHFVISRMPGHNAALHARHLWTLFVRMKELYGLQWLKDTVEQRIRTLRAGAMPYAPEFAEERYVHYCEMYASMLQR